METTRCHFNAPYLHRVLGLSISLELLHTYFFDRVKSGFDTHWPSVQAQQGFSHRVINHPKGAIELGKSDGKQNNRAHSIARTSGFVIQCSRDSFVGISHRGRNWSASDILCSRIMLTTFRLIQSVHSTRGQERSIRRSKSSMPQ